jgi:nucleoid-associated protein YgaU
MAIHPFPVIGGLAMPGGSPTPPMLADLLDRLGLLPKGLRIQRQGNAVVLQGEATDLPAHERALLAVGNIQGVGKVDDRIRPVPGAPLPFGPGASKVHEVKPRETLASIAQQHYRDARAANAILEANSPVLANALALRPGWVLRIPPQGGA